jgi:hypothetical protein
MRLKCAGYVDKKAFQVGRDLTQCWFFRRPVNASHGRSKILFLTKSFDISEPDITSLLGIDHVWDEAQNLLVYGLLGLEIHPILYGWKKDTEQALSQTRHRRSGNR